MTPKCSGMQRGRRCRSAGTRQTRRAWSWISLVTCTALGAMVSPGGPSRFWGLVDLPVEQPTRLTLRLHRRLAKALGRTIPQSVPRRVDEVIP